VGSSAWMVVVLAMARMWPISGRKATAHGASRHPRAGPTIPAPPPVRQR
jgi:hypothetical protein